MSEPQIDPWHHGAGASLVYSGWAEHVTQPYAGALLVALMMEFRGVVFVVAFDGFFYDAVECPEDRDQLCTLSLWAIARAGYGASSVEAARGRAPVFIGTWLAGWRAAMAVSP